MGNYRAGRADFAKAVRIIKKFSNVEYPIFVRRQRLSKAVDGYCSLDDDSDNPHFLIQINREVPYYFAIDVLLHEAAHAMAWDKDKDDHGLNWGKAYSKIYRIFLREYYD